MEENRAEAVPVNVKEAVETPLITKEKAECTFIKPQQINVKAAYERAEITKDTLKLYREEINRTNTADIAGTLRRLYEDLEKTMKEIIKEEKQLIMLGE